MTPQMTPSGTLIHVATKQFALDTMQKNKTTQHKKEYHDSHPCPLYLHVIVFKCFINTLWQRSEFHWWRLIGLQGRVEHNAFGRGSDVGVVFTRKKLRKSNWCHQEQRGGTKQEKSTNSDQTVQSQQLGRKPELLCYHPTMLPPWHQRLRPPLFLAAHHNRRERKASVTAIGGLTHGAPVDGLDLVFVLGSVPHERQPFYSCQSAARDRRTVRRTGGGRVTEQAQGR